MSLHRDRALSHTLMLAPHRKQTKLVPTSLGGLKHKATDPTVIWKGTASRQVLVREIASVAWRPIVFTERKVVYANPRIGVPTALHQRILHLHLPVSFFLRMESPS
eukprot:Lithocolla_globosa_v1_NODE_4589_length_1404_cov_14.862861.p3 type:complete len:106 gc:universal NODE_4589_length_1404_cov_14.862861:960-643(-)